MKPNYETGATTHAVNDLILFTDNTRILAQKRDEIYRKYIKPSPKLADWKESMRCEFLKSLQPTAAHQYDKEFNYTGNEHITQMSEEERNEYATIYANDFESWKKEHA